jgi:SAM-dependent MidA family methyltransferase
MPVTDVYPQAGAVELPLPDAAALAHSILLVDRIHAEIAHHDGRIGFDRYMEMALYEPGLGYYSAGAGKFGVHGDFVTAPELSPLFSICLARQCREVLDRLNGGAILELGAGSGRMAVDLLSELLRAGSPPASYMILETSADLRHRQQQLLQQELPDFISRITWLDRLPEQPLSGVILANEVIDAMPVRRVTVRQGELMELLVCRLGRSFDWITAPADPSLRRQVNALQQLRRSWPEYYATEFNPNLPHWIASLSDCLGRGVVLLIDYGYPRNEYYHPQRSHGTLLCHYRHRVHADPFLYPGLQDITASVDFTAVADAADAAGLVVAGYTAQAYFLLGCGLDQLMELPVGGNTRAHLERVNQARRLTMPGEMGERYKVMALTRDMADGLRGFAIADQRHFL